MSKGVRVVPVWLLHTLHIAAPISVAGSLESVTCNPEIHIAEPEGLAHRYRHGLCLSFHLVCPAHTGLCVWCD